MLLHQGFGRFAAEVVSDDVESTSLDELLLGLWAFVEKEAKEAQHRLLHVDRIKVEKAIEHLRVRELICLQWRIRMRVSFQ